MRKGGDLFKSEGATAVFAAFTALDVRLQHEFLKAAQSALAVTHPSPATTSLRAREALRGLNEAAALNDGESPTRNRYEELRRDNAECEWPASRSVLRWLGVRTWNQALRQAHLESVVDGDILARERGPIYSAAELKSALRECKQDVGTPPTSNQYSAWSIRPDVVSRPGRRPTSVEPMVRTFGKWTRALVAAGLITSEDDAVVSISGHVRRAGFRIPVEKLLDDIRFMEKRLGHVPRCGEYDHEREKLTDEVIRRGGGGRALASYATIQKKFGTWNAALEKAGFDPFDMPPRRTAGVFATSGQRIPTEYLINALREASAASGGGRIGMPAFKAWREAALEADPRRAGEIPSIGVYWRRFATWQSALDAAFPETVGPSSANDAPTAT